MSLARTALALALVAHLVACGEEAGTDAVAGPGVRAAEAAAERERADLVAPAQATRAGEDGAPVGARAGAVVDEADAAEYETPVEGGRVVRVVHADGGAPAARAEVWFVASGALGPQDLLALRDGGADFVGFLRARGRRFRADADGETRVPWGESAALIAAQRGDATGFAQALPSDGAEALVVEVRPPVTVRARVVDGGGAAVAGARVAIELREETHRQSILSAATDGDGVAAFEGIGPLLQEIRRAEEDVRIFVALDGLFAREGAESREAELDLDALPTEPVVLTLPPTGRVELRVVPPGGGALEGDRVCGLARAGEPGSEGLLSRMGLAGTTPVPADGRVAFAHVGLGLELVAQVGRTGSYDEPARAAFVGPRVAGEVVPVTVALPAGEVRLAGRVIGPDGEPLAGITLTAECRVAGAGGALLGVRSTRRPVQELLLQLDAEGRFEVPLPADWLAEAEPGQLVVPPTRVDGTTVGARVALPPLAPGPNAVGDVALAELPLLAEGLVVDAAGDGLQGASIGLRERVGVPLADGSADARWNYVPRLQVRSGPGGAFALRGFVDELPDGQLGLVATTEDGGTLEPVPFAVGERGVVLTIDPFGSLVGRVLLDEATADAHLVLGSDALDGRRHVALDDDGSFEARHLPPGGYAAHVLVGGAEVNGSRIEGVAVTPGDPSTDARLDPLDLRGAVAELVVTVVAADGGEFRYANVMAQAGQDGDATWHPVEDGRAVVPLVTATADIEVQAFGYRTQRLPNVSGDVTVTLEPALRVRIVIPPLPDLPNGWLASLSLRPLEGQNDGVGSLVTPVREEFETLYVDEPGRYAVQWLVIVQDGFGARYHGVAQEAPQEVVLTDAVEGQVLELEPPPAGALEAAVPDDD